MWRRVIDCLGVAVEISARVPGLDVALDAVFRSYQDAPGRPDLVYRLEVGRWPQVVRDGQRVCEQDEEMDLVPALETDLYAQVMARAPGLLLHAGALVGAGGAALVFAGRSGAGKSTLVRALLARGYAYLTEECVALSPGGACAGLARPLHLDEDEAADLPDFRCDDYVIRRGAERVRKRLLHPPEERIWRGAARAAAVVQIDHAPDAAPSLEPMSGGDALAALWPLAFRADEAAMADAARALEGVARYRMRTSRAEQAIERALSLAAEHGVEPA